MAMTQHSIWPESLIFLQDIEGRKECDSSQHKGEKETIYQISKSRTQEARCGACKGPSTEAKCKLFCEPCDMFICHDCKYHINEGADDGDDDYIHETNITVGTYAKHLAESRKQHLEAQMQRYENIRNDKLEYREYLEWCVSKCQYGEELFQETINEVNYNLKSLHILGEKIQTKYDDLKAVYKRHDAMMLVKRRHTWTDHVLELSNLERRHKPRICMAHDGSVANEYPTVKLEYYCSFHGIQNQDLSPRKVQRAWILHAGSLYLFSGGYQFWEDYYQSEIRPFVTVAESKTDEILVYLMQISGCGGQWTRNDIEMSGQPFAEAVTTDRFGSSFVLCKTENAVSVHRGPFVTKVSLPVVGRSAGLSPVVICVDSERDMLCVYAIDPERYQDEVYVYKITYTFDQKPGNNALQIAVTCQENASK